MNTLDKIYTLFAQYEEILLNEFFNKSMYTRLGMEKNSSLYKLSGILGHGRTRVVFKVDNVVAKFGDDDDNEREFKYYSAHTSNKYLAECFTYKKLHDKFNFLAQEFVEGNDIEHYLSNEILIRNTNPQVFLEDVRQQAKSFQIYDITSKNVIVTEHSYKIVDYAECII